MDEYIGMRQDWEESIISGRIRDDLSFKSVWTYLALSADSSISD